MMYVFAHRLPRSTRRSGRWVRIALATLCVTVLPPASAGQTAAGTPGADKPEKADDVARFPAKLVDIGGNELDVTQLATDHNLVVVTLKATWCPVCQHQLERIRDLLPKLEPCNVTFIVLSPGPAEDLAKIQERIGFRFPFVADADLAVARPLGLDRPGGQIFPCMFQLLKDRRIGWKQLGRNGAYFGDGELERYFDCRPV